ncbi:recombinase family protein [Mycobacterium sp. 852002-30065_SCH5024008]|uniref:recombinase family protein n=1 Tax=Mycobacterium sp. 852002-30065_SCH5024008 TaxID=1834088 RepID=UPI0007FDF015|nr:recombinase family protein [Mycobacterium sp. 852002-30065_SCH5024008]OBB89649.1 serine recombinase [Mycobacterium sp. 852002-30065_SCH5024008]
MATEITENPQVRAGCYCRISSDPKDKRQGVDRQREDTTVLCEVKKWVPAGFYIDNDRSATNGKARPEWERLLADVKAGKIDAIAAWNQDRGWRLMRELETLREFFTGLDRRVPLATTGQGDIDLYSPDGVLQAQVKTAVSEHEVAMLKVRTKRAARQRAEQGVPAWRRAFGYGEDRRPDPRTAPLVAEAYRAIIAGSSLGDICKAWNAAGALTLNGKLWTQPQLSNFLRKARNAGLRSHNGELVVDAQGEAVKGNWPALVDEATWRRAQNVLNAPGRAPGRKTVQRHKLTGVLLCGACGHHLSGLQTLDKKRIAYRCKQCLGVSIRAEHVEPFLYKVVSARLAREDAVDLLKADLHDTAEAECIRTEKSVLHGRLNELAIERAQGLLTGAQVKTATEIVQAQIDTLDAQEQDQERLRVFDQIPLGKPEVAAAIESLSPDRFRAILSVLAKITIAPVGKGGHTFRPDRVQIDWL